MGNNNAHARASTALLSTTALPSFNAFVAAATAAGAQELKGQQAVLEEYLQQQVQRKRQQQQEQQQKLTALGVQLHAAAAAAASRVNLVAGDLHQMTVTRLEPYMPAAPKAQSESAVAGGAAAATQGLHVPVLHSLMWRQASITGLSAQTALPAQVVA